jgi:hypothetical protein
MVCPACAHDTFDGSTCSRCGYAAGDRNKCPHCGSIAREENGRCAVCGGPRVHGGFGGENAANALRETKTHLGTAAGAKAALVALGFGVLMSLLFALGVSLATGLLLAKVLTFGASAFLAFMATRAFSRMRSAEEKAGEAKERAMLAAAEDVAKRRDDGVTAEELGKALAIDAAQAEKLLTELAVHERTRIDVGDDAEVRYSVAPELKIRVGEEAEEDEHDVIAKKKMELP